MNIDDMKFGELKEIAALMGNRSDSTFKPSPYRVGKNYFIRTATNYLTGKLIAVYEHELVFEHAAWIAHTGRFADAMLDFDKLDEVEPFPVDANVILHRASIVDSHVTLCELPTKQI